MTISKLSTALLLALVLTVAGTMVYLNAKDKAKIQVALLLDTSGSMSGLINQAKNQLWSIVNELALSKYEGRTPQLEIALYEYGNDGLSAESGFIRQITGLTTDLDAISEKLFALSTNGGSEHCGQVIQTAIDNLQWSSDNNDLKIIFIAGNEGFGQGPVAYTEACKNAISKGVIVNTIFCGDYNTGIQSMWKDGADLADGQYSNINHTVAVRHIVTPMDNALDSLSRAINATYLGYGALGVANRVRQERQDKNAAAAGMGNVAQRAMAKASDLYMNSSWDLVDATDDGTVELDEVEVEALPEEMRGMEMEERKQYLEEKRQQRSAIQKRIEELSVERRKYIAEQEKNEQQNTLDKAMLKAVRDQAQSRNYVFGR